MLKENEEICVICKKLIKEKQLIRVDGKPAHYNHHGVIENADSLSPLIKELVKAGDRSLLQTVIKRELEKDVKV